MQVEASFFDRFDDNDDAANDSSKEGPQDHVIKLLTDFIEDMKK